MAAATQWFLCLSRADWPVDDVSWHGPLALDAGDVSVRQGA